MFSFFNKLYRMDDPFKRLLHKLYALQGTRFQKPEFEETLMELLEYLVHQHRHLVKQLNNIPAIKPSTRVELFRRLSQAMDLIHTSTSFETGIDELAAAACLSKYHFIRLFKLAFQTSPYQYMQQLKLDQAESLLKKTRLPVQDIAYSLGFENGNSLSRLFYKRKGVYPDEYRK
jgi:AraC family transcriptional regulator